MLKKLNTLFFALCFIAALIAVGYSLHVLEGELVSFIGFSLVALIMGYLLLDSIRSAWMEEKAEIKQYFLNSNKEDNEKAVIDLYKASYVAIKKIGTISHEQLEQMNKKLSDLEYNHSQLMESLIVIQNKSLEGQKNSLNLMLNYNNENTKAIVNAIKEDNNHIQYNQLIGKLEEILEHMKMVEQVEKQEAPKLEEPPVVQPLYDDPNKKLSTDEIASLFATYGQ